MELGKSIRQYLSTSDCRCEWVQTLLDAKERLSIYQYECMMLDFGLPDGPGFDKGQLFMNATDLFKTMDIKTSVKGEALHIKGPTINETQVIRLGYSYKF